MKVFLSSTGRDLKAYREAAFKALLGLDMHPVRMEDFHGEAIKIEDFDDKRIDDCDLFVIILGHLHGTCPEGSEKSYTELEYETAQRLKKPCFLFLAPEDFSFPASLIESDDKRAKQRAHRLLRIGKIPIVDSGDLSQNLLAPVDRAGGFQLLL